MRYPWCDHFILFIDLLHCGNVGAISYEFLRVNPFAVKWFG